MWTRKKRFDVQAFFRLDSVQSAKDNFAYHLGATVGVAQQALKGGLCRHSQTPKTLIYNPGFSLKTRRFTIPSKAQPSCGTASRLAVSVIIATQQFTIQTMATTNTNKRRRRNLRPTLWRQRPLDLGRHRCRVLLRLRQRRYRNSEFSQTPTPAIPTPHSPPSPQTKHPQISSGENQHDRRAIEFTWRYSTSPARSPSKTRACSMQIAITHSTRIARAVPQREPLARGRGALPAPEKKNPPPAPSEAPFPRAPLHAPASRPEPLAVVVSRGRCVEPWQDFQRGTSSALVARGRSLWTTPRCEQVRLRRLAVSTARGVGGGVCVGAGAGSGLASAVGGEGVRAGRDREGR